MTIRTTVILLVCTYTQLDLWISIFYPKGRIFYMSAGHNLSICSYLLACIQTTCLHSGSSVKCTEYRITSDYRLMLLFLVGVSSYDLDGDSTWELIRHHATVTLVTHLPSFRTVCHTVGPALSSITRTSPSAPPPPLPSVLITCPAPSFAWLINNA